MIDRRTGAGAARQCASRGSGAGPEGGARLGRLELAAIWCVGALTLVGAWLYPVWSTAVRIHCPLWTLAGIPCPTCGATRALVAAAAGHWSEALAWNPAAGLAGLVLPFLLPVGAAWLWSGRPGPRVPTRLSPATRWGAGVLLALQWGYLVLRFPG